MQPTSPRAPSWVLLIVLAVVAAGVVVVNLPPWSFLTRQDLPSCGEVDPDPSTGEVPEAQVACLAAARAAGAGAELLVTAHTTEGDAIRVYYRVVPGREGIERFIETPDGYGDAGWSHDYCPQAGVLPDVGTCHEV